MPYVKVHHRNGGSERKFLDAFSLIAVTVAGYLMLVIIGECVLRIGLVAHILIFAALMMMLVSPAAVVIKAQMIEAKALGESSCHERTRLMEDNLGAPEEQTYYRVAADRTCAQHDPTAPNKLACGSGHEPSSGDLILPQRGENFSITKAMSTCDFWLLFLAMACGMGSGLATVNNISQIGGSLGYTNLETSTLVSLWSIWNFLGRFGSGYMSDYFLRRKGWARPLFIALTLAVMSVGHAVISTGLPGSLYVGSVLVGICYGSQWSLMPSITSELFGLRHFGPEGFTSK
ncbi:hypothetical protein B296_00036747 [Ensete ventricosum]|uniref:Major facilitator superfamily (MFS) profile domain-containing protein n=1 Tax=Ensete ventricosum TaxID=4639 RepID=A0A427A1H5_ENSVE|nr:hypothetical protein B296_00036747 [Ensete ventricosum]